MTCVCDTVRSKVGRLPQRMSGMGRCLLAETNAVGARIPSTVVKADPNEVLAMQLRLWTSILIFGGSYFPLALILLAQDVNFVCARKLFKGVALSEGDGCVLPLNHPGISISILLICVFCLVFSWFVLKMTRTKRTCKIMDSKHVPSELMSYTLPYVVAFMGVSYDQKDKLIGMVVFLVWLFWITHKSGQIILNPALIVLGWRLYDVTYVYSGCANELRGHMLADHEIGRGDVVRYNDVEDVVIAKKNMNEGGDGESSRS
ncbi:membrane hypothetical protein [uncultured Alphaproteobacteria bacterium]|uniref:Uncharacterized protein n=1 Tax=uncultured Alphaproteobacteria bacterium TaxID=91750 RepID=A0A212JZV5_9PROT|nr:membrane hypothetical protein [uncultured Alphaproteobacteria bacterium]